MNDPRSVLVRIVVVLVFAGMSTAAVAEDSTLTESLAFAREPAGVLSLRDAIALALARSPDLAAYSWELRAADARRTQAALPPNPELGLQLENAGGTLPGLAASEFTLSLGQLVEMGGKRKARIDASEGESAVLRIDYEARRLALVSDVALRFVDGLAIERSIGIADEALQTAAETDSAVGLRVMAGASSSADKARAEAELARTRLDRRTLDAERDLAWTRLASLWGATDPRFTGLGGALDSVPRVPPLDSLLARAEFSPDVARWEAQILSREKALRLERSNAAADIQVGVGYRYLAESEDHTLLAGLALPLRFFDRNQGNIAASAAAADGARAGLSRAAVARRAEIAQAHIVLRREAARIETLRREVLPKTERAFEEVRAGFERGRFSYLDLLDARRSWIESRRDELLSLIEFHRTRTELERLVAGPLSPIATEDK